MASPWDMMLQQQEAPKSLDEQYLADLNQRKAFVQQLRERTAQPQEEQGFNFQRADLGPALAIADSILGTRTAQSYRGPQMQTQGDQERLRLQALADKEQQAIQDDQMALLKLKELAANNDEKNDLKAQFLDAYRNKVDKGDDKSDRSNEFKLRNEWDSDPITKNTKTITEGYQKISDSYNKNTRASDLSLIYGLMRLQDPNSTVRESEFEMAQKIGGFPAQTQAYFQTLAGKGRLTLEQRNAIKQEAEGLYGSQLSRQQEVDAAYTELARQYGFEPSRVVLSSVFKRKDKSAPKAPASNSKIQPGFVDEGYRFKGGDPNDPKNWEEVK